MRRLKKFLNLFLTDCLFSAKIREVSSFNNSNKSLIDTSNMKKIALFFSAIILFEIMVQSYILLTFLGVNGTLALFTTSEQRVNASVPFTLFVY